MDIKLYNRTFSMDKYDAMELMDYFRDHLPTTYNEHMKANFNPTEEDVRSIRESAIEDYKQSLINELVSQLNNLV